MNRHQIDELLESVWKCREEGRCTVQACLSEAHQESDRQDLEQMQTAGLIVVERDRVRLTARGEQEASEIIRRHRLAERLFTDVLGLTIDRIEEAACTFEHAVVPEVTAALCTMLGHPTECPHGHPIPPGECCRTGRREVGCALMALADVPCGPIGRVAYLRARSHRRLLQLLSMGFSPGVKICLHQREPVLVVGIDQSEFAMDREVAKDVYLWLDPSMQRLAEQAEAIDNPVKKAG